MLENVLARWALMELSVIHVPRDFQVKTVKSATMDSMDILTAKVGFFLIFLKWFPRNLTFMRSHDAETNGMP